MGPCEESPGREPANREVITDPDEVQRVLTHYSTYPRYCDWCRQGGVGIKAELNKPVAVWIEDTRGYMLATPGGQAFCPVCGWQTTISLFDKQHEVQYSDHTGRVIVSKLEEIINLLSGQFSK